MPCNNINTNFCTNNVHNIINAMIAGREQQGFIGGLFNDTEYHIFENQKCVQYLQEYIPLHLPIIRNELVKTINKYFIGFGEINILDFCAGPATVALAFCRIFGNSEIKKIINIDTIEASNGFNEMISKFKMINTCNCVNINNQFKFNVNCGIEEKIPELNYDWIILANAISAIGQEHKDDFAYINNYFNKLFTKILQNKKTALLTIIESNVQKFFKITEYLNQTEKIAGINLIAEKIRPSPIYLPFPEIGVCEKYMTIKDNPKIKPCLNTVTIKFEKLIPASLTDAQFAAKYGISLP